MYGRRIVAVCLVVALCSLPQVVVAQSSDAEKWHALMVQFEPAAFVSVRLNDGTRLKGTVVSAQETSFTLQVRTRIPVPAREIRYTEVAAVERAKIGMNPAAKVLLGVGISFGALLITLAALFAGD